MAPAPGARLSAKTLPPLNPSHHAGFYDLQDRRSAGGSAAARKELIVGLVGGAGVAALAVLLVSVIAWLIELAAWMTAAPIWGGPLCRCAQ